MEESIALPQRSKLIPQGFFVIDIETTGASLFLDKCFAIGLAYGSSRHSVTTFNACVNLRKPVDRSWKDHWDACGFEKRCFDEFWGNNEPTLNLLQDGNQVQLYDSEKDLVSVLNAFLTDMEAQFENINLVTNTTAFDTVWITYLLQKYGYPGLGYTRSGQYRRAFEVNSYKRGVYGVGPTEINYPWREDGNFLVTITSPHDHHPEHDALQIYQTWFASIEANERRTNMMNNIMNNMAALWKNTVDLYQPK